ncbi:hypothetical protein [Achromobacter aloeverae]|uniref:Uncharacterized protein n=1 Tax=Achromobacter aloeverae TaxID=1750518 RepID=A0A4Q1HJR8_9BURK|nr:hypothetical protein [Achromobacter aloeverae]RXN90364.1 hypothetical protein C7R54_12690 [Achromobacter aloeverae]
MTCETGSLTGSSVESPDYASAFVTVFDTRLGVVNLNANNLPYIGLFKARIWKDCTATLSARSGDGLSAAFGRYFQTPLSVKIKDSTGSTQGTHAMAVRFDIIEGDATFDPAGCNQRFLTINDTTAQVFSEYGTAFAPRIKAGKTAGTVTVRASSRFAAQSYDFQLQVVDPRTDSDAAFVYTQAGDYQDRVAAAAPGGQFPTLLQVKVENRRKEPAATGNIIFAAYPMADGQWLSVWFPDGNTASVAVDEGYATAPTLVTQIVNNTPASGYAANVICAYPDTYDIEDQDPRTDTSGQVARFTERVWNSNAATVGRDDARNNQTAAPGQYFPFRLTATIKDAARNPVDQMLVTFTLQGPGQFDSQDDVPVEQWNAGKVVVRTGGDGLAIAPRILAQPGKSGAITVTPSCPVSNDQPTYALTSAIPANEGVSVGVGEGDYQDQVLQAPFVYPLTVAVKTATGDNATAGQVTFTCQGTSQATGSFNGAPTATAPVNGGAAIAPATLRGDNILQSTQSYGYFEVTAISDYADQPCTFHQRVWRSKHAILTAVSGNSSDDNKAQPGDLFPIPVVVHVAGPDNEDIENLWVTFTLQGSAEFVYDEGVPAQTGDTAASATVRTDRFGKAYAPDIRAGKDAGPVTVTADATVAQNPLPFNLTVLPIPTNAFYVYVDPDTNYQDTTMGLAYATPLSASVKNYDGTDATTGQVTFEIFNGTASGVFYDGGTKSTVNVINGRATAGKLSATLTSGTGSFNVVAYPTVGFSGDPATDTSNQTAHFTERVWDDVYVALAKTDGDNQHATTNQYFAQHLTVRATDTRGNNTPVPEYLVTFSISNPGMATFDTADPDVIIVSGNSRAVTVRGDDNGHATAPRILAGANAGGVQVHVFGGADPGTIFKLTVDSDQPAPGTVTNVYVSQGDYQDQYATDPYPIALAVSATDSQNKFAQTGQVTFKIFQGTADGAGFSGVTGDNTTVTVAVNDGHATAPTVIAGAGPIQGYGDCHVVAFPSTFTGDPLSDTSTQTAHFTLRAWIREWLDITKQNDGQTALVQQYFAQRLQVNVFDKSSNAPLAYYIMTFTITGDATFDTTDVAARILSGDGKSVSVQGDAQGNITAPRILAGSTAGSVVVNAQGNLSSGTSFNLTVQADQQPILYTLKPASAALNVAVNGSQPAIFNLTDNNTRKGVAQKPVTMTIVNTGSAQASFKQGDPTATTTSGLQTDSTGQVSATVYGNGQAGSATLTASNPNANDSSEPVNIR